MFDIEWAGAAAGADQSPLDHSQFCQSGIYTFTHFKHYHSA